MTKEQKIDMPLAFLPRLSVKAKTKEQSLHPK